MQPRGAPFQNSQIIALSLEARNVAGLLSLQAGVVYTGIYDKNLPENRGGAVTGARSDQTNVTLDGVDVNDQQTGEAFKSVLPVTVDSVQEYRFCHFECHGKPRTIRWRSGFDHHAKWNAGHCP
jgi:hypothetical protein